MIFVGAKIEQVRAAGRAVVANEVRGGEIEVGRVGEGGLGQEFVARGGKGERIGQIRQQRFKGFVLLNDVGNRPHREVKVP